MDKLLLLLCAASALSVVSSLPARQYYFIYEQKTWTEARSYCREKFTDLATVDSLEDVETLRTMAVSAIVDGRYIEEAWIGLYDDVNSWRWSLSDRSFYKDDEINFRNWGTNQPDNHGVRERCTRMTDIGHWLDVPCSYSYKSACADVRGQEVTFVFIEEYMKFTEAQSYCREHHTDLASVRNMAENQEIKELIPAGQTLWLGLFRDGWTWTDGRKLSFAYWASGSPYSPDQNCVAANIKDGGRWKDRNCNTKAEFICHNVPFSKQVVKVKLEGSSSLDLQDPAVQEDLLLQLEQRLQKQGLKARLSWRMQKDGKIFQKDGKIFQKDLEES